MFMYFYVQPGHRPGGQKKTPNSRDSMVEIEPVLTFTAEEVENFKAKALQSTRIIDNLEESRKVINEIFLGVRPGGYIAVSMGTEGVNLGPKGQVTLIQIGLMTGQVLIFDIQKCKELVFNGGLLKLMESQDVVKVSFIIFKSKETLHLFLPYQNTRIHYQCFAFSQIQIRRTCCQIQNF